MHSPCRGMEMAIEIAVESRRMETEEERAVEKSETTTIVTTLEIVHETDGGAVKLASVDAKARLE